MKDIRLSQRGMASVAVKRMCELEEKIYGNRLIVLVVANRERRISTICVFPVLLLFVIFDIVSTCMFFIAFMYSFKVRPQNK